MGFGQDPFTARLTLQRYTGFNHEITFYDMDDGGDVKPLCAWIHLHVDDKFQDVCTFEGTARWTVAIPCMGPRGPYRVFASWSGRKFQVLGAVAGQCTGWRPVIRGSTMQFGEYEAKQYCRKNGTNEQPGKTYFPQTIIPDIIGNAPMQESSSTCNVDIEKGTNDAVSGGFDCGSCFGIKR